VKSYEMREKTSRLMALLAVACAALVLLGCHKGNQAFNVGKKGQTAQNYDASLKGYEQALKEDPENTQYKLKTYQMRFEASQFHVKQGIKYLEEQHYQPALQEFQTALSIDPSSAVARQEIEYTQRLIASQPGATPKPAGEASSQPDATQPGVAAPEEAKLMEAPPALIPISREPITLQMNAEARTVFRTLGKLAGVNVIFDPDFQDHKISVDLVTVTIQQALNVACVESKAFWKPVSSNIVLVMPDTSSKRKEQEEQVLQKIYLGHRQTPQELMEITTTIQQMLELRHVQALPRDNAILIRDTPAKILLATQLIHDSDRGRPEVVVQISVLQVRRDKARSLGIQPGSSTTLAFTPAGPLGPEGRVALDKLSELSHGDFSVTIPNAVATALFTDSATKIIQNPEVRVSDGESARLRVGDRIPIATGSFQATGGLTPIVNTQFQYIDVGVNIDLTPRVHPDRSVSMRLGVEVSSLNGQVNIGGVLQPIISQRRIDHEIRLNEGEVSILGGLAERAQTKSVSGWPFLSRLPLLHYLFSGEDVSNSENEVLIVITPRLVRMRDVARESLHALSVGTDAEMVLRQREDVELPVAAHVKPAGSDPPNTAAPGLEKEIEAEATLQLQPSRLTVKEGDIVPIQVEMADVKDLFSASLLIKYDPQALSIEDVRHGDFLSGGTQEVAIIQRIDKEKGEARIYTTRRPNTAGVDGKGVLLEILVRHLTSTPASLQVVEVGIRTSRQRSIPVTISQGSTTIQ
jgi:general secretion pathway protein D